MSKNAPKTVDWITRLATLRTIKGWTYKEVIHALNQHLPDEQKFSVDQNGINLVERMMKTGRRSWAQPRGEVVLAVQAVVEASSKQSR